MVYFNLFGGGEGVLPSGGGNGQIKNRVIDSSEGVKSLGGSDGQEGRIHHIGGGAAMSGSGNLSKEAQSTNQLSGRGKGGSCCVTGKKTRYLHSRKKRYADPAWE